jgi:hypothetical protein
VKVADSSSEFLSFSFLKCFSFSIFPPLSLSSSQLLSFPVQSFSLWLFRDSQPSHAPAPGALGHPSNPSAPLISAIWSLPTWVLSKSTICPKYPSIPTPSCRPDVPSIHGTQCALAAGSLGAGSCHQAVTVARVAMRAARVVCVTWGSCITCVPMGQHST